MSFCHVCKANHDPAFPCYDRTAELLRDAGMGGKGKASRVQGQAAQDQGERMLIWIVVASVALVGLAFLVMALAS